MTKELQNIIEEWRDNGADISDEEAESVLLCCNLKMIALKVENRDKYLPLLFADEIKNYIIRKSINNMAIILMEKKELR